MSEAIVRKMAERHPGLATVTLPNRGHAPMLDEPVAIAVIDRFPAALESNA